MIVIANGMLRSASTLQYNLAARVLETVGPLTRVGFLGDLSRSDMRVKLESMKATAGWNIFKTHDVPLERDFYDYRTRVVFSYRDVRDIAASIKKKWGFPFEKILSDIALMIEIEREFREIPNILFQSYEKLYYELPSATREIAQFLEIELTDDDIVQIAGSMSVGASKARIQARAKNPLARLLGRAVGRLSIDPITLLHDNHISASDGRAGDWLNQFDTVEREELEDAFGCWLIQHGYALSAGSGG